jgi:antitoxin component YwqK of YwqJK toxin-antitoxin module
MKNKISIIVIFLIKSVIIFAQEEGVEYYARGKVKARSEVVNGLQKNTYYYESGSIQTVSYWKDKKREGVMIHYYENGNIKIYSNYKNGLENGPTIMNYENGVTSEIQHLINGKLEGPITEFYEDGTLRAFRIIHNDTVMGHSAFYYPDGKIKKKRFMDENGTGEVYNYDIDGKIISVSFYEKGEFVREEIR